MALSNLKLSQNGMSLIEVLVALALMSIIAVGLSTIIVNANNEQKALQEKLALIETQNNIISSLNNSATCYAQLNQTNPVLDLTPLSLPTAVVNIPQINAGTLPTSTLLAKVGQPLPGYAVGQMVVKTIQLKSINASGPPNEFSGDLEITLDPASVSRAMKPIRVKQFFTVLPPLNAAKIAGCGSVKHIGPWVPEPTSVAVLAPSDGLVIATSCSNCGIILSTGSSVAGTCVGTIFTMRLKVAARDKYGQGVVSASIPVSGGECWKSQSIDVHGNIHFGGQLIFFRATD